MDPLAGFGRQTGVGKEAAIRGDLGLLPPAQTADIIGVMIRRLVLAICLLLASVPTWASTSRSAARSAPRSAVRSAARSERRSTVARAGSSTKKCGNLRARRQWKNRAEPGGLKSVPGRPSLPGNRQDLGGVPGVRC